MMTKEKPGSFGGDTGQVETMPQSSISYLDCQSILPAKSILDHALGYQEMGLFILPLMPGEKKPYTKWAHRRDNKPDQAEIKEWWSKYPDAQIGMATGVYSGLDVVDFDNCSVSMPHFEAMVHDIPETFSVTTGRLDGGQHFYFKHNGSDFKNISKPKDKNGYPIDVDLRTTGGIVVLPPSQHKSGNYYQWDNLNPLDMDDWQDELQVMPPKMVTFFEAASGANNSDSESVKLDLSQILSGINDGERDTLLFKYGCRLRGKNLEYPEAKAMIINLAKSCTPPFPKKEAIKKLDQAWRYDPGFVELATEAWESPVTLKEGHAPELDPNLLPGIIGDMARAVSTETETPIELAAGLIISVLGTACQGKFMVKIKPGYQEPVNIWTVTALDPANRKSSVLMKITSPLSQWETMKHLELDVWIKEAASKLQNQEARIKSLRAQYGKANQEDLKAIEAEIMDIENNLVQVPSYPKIWAQDVTPEHLGTLLNRYDEVMSILSSEGGIFDIIGGRYSNGVANLDLFLQAHSGDPVRVDRGSRDPVFLNSPALTLGLSPQPEVLRGLADKPGFRGKGLLARVLYFLPKSKLGYRGLDSESVPENIKIAYQNLIFQLLDIVPGEDEHGEKQPYILHFSKQAYQEWSEFYMVVEKDLREGGRFEFITDWAGKLPGAAARIAGLLHCAKNQTQPWTETIGLETMQNALGIAATFADHALIAFDLMGADRSLEEARKVWRWVEHGRQESFIKNECFNALKGTFHRVANLEEPLRVLAERNYIRELPREKKVGKPSVKYSVNPEIIEGWS